MLICRLRPVLRSLLALLGGLALIADALAAGYAADAAPTLSWEDRDFDGLPDWADPYADDFSNNTVWWEGEFLIDGVRVTVSGWFADEGPDWNDDDGDWLPNFMDPYVDDPTNNTAFWNGAAWIDGQWQEIAEPYPASSAALLDLSDLDEDLLPDVFDPYPEDGSNNTAVWNGGEFVIDGETRTLTGAGERYAADGGDVDGDHIPDFADPYAEDAGNDGREPVFGEPVTGVSVDGEPVSSGTVAAGVSTPTVALSTPAVPAPIVSTPAVPAPAVPPPALDDAAVLALLDTGSLPAPQTQGEGTAPDEAPPDPLSAASAAEVEQLVLQIAELAQRPRTFNAEADAETLGWITQMLVVEPGGDPAAALSAALAFRQTPHVTAQDSDGDGLDDLEETLTYLTDLTNPDTDGDGFFDEWEIAHGLDPLDFEDNTTADTDNDGLSNEEELAAGTHPLHADSDYGGVIDGIETRVARLRALLGENTPQEYSATNPLDPQDDVPQEPQQENQPPIPPEPEADPDYHAPLDEDGDGVFTPDDPDDHDPAVPGMPQNGGGGGGNAGGGNNGGAGEGNGSTTPPEQPDPFADVDGDGVPAALDPDDHDPLVPNRPQLIDEPPLPPEPPQPPGGALQLPPEIQGPPAPPKRLKEQWEMEKQLREQKLKERRDRLTAEHKDGIAKRDKQRQEQNELNDLMSHPHGNHGLGVKYAGSRGRRSEDNDNGALPFMANEGYAESVAFKRQQNNDALRAWLGPKLDRMEALSGQKISAAQRQRMQSQLKGVMTDSGKLDLKAAAGIISAALEHAGIHFLPEQPTVSNGGRVVPGVIGVLSMSGGAGGTQPGAGTGLSALQQDEEDADDDGYSNGEERAMGSDPDDFNSVPATLSNRQRIDLREEAAKDWQALNDPLLAAARAAELNNRRLEELRLSLNARMAALAGGLEEQARQMKQEHAALRVMHSWVDENGVTHYMRVSRDTPEWLTQVIMGEGYEGERSNSGTAAEVVVDFTPWGVVADFRDIGITGNTFLNDPSWSGLGKTGLATVGLIPVLGTWAKGYFKAGREVAGEGIEAGLRSLDDLVPAANRVIYQSGHIRGGELAGDLLENAAIHGQRSASLLQPNRTARYSTEVLSARDPAARLMAQEGEWAAFNLGNDTAYFLPQTRRIEVLEEVLHATQNRLGIIDRLGINGADIHVREFMLRHQRMLGISDADASVLRSMLNGAKAGN